jgi:hypothetical protein
MRDAARLRVVIEASGLSARRFAVDVMSRDERTVRRWLAGEPMPPTVRAWLDSLDGVFATDESITVVIRAAP